MDERDTQELALEDILKEFGDGEEAQESQLPETAQETEMSDTVALPVIGKGVPKAAVTQDTVRIYRPENEKNNEQSDWREGDTRPLGTGEQLSDTIPMPAVDGATKKLPGDKLSGEREEEVQEYTPYRPIQFQPKSQIREMKRKLVAGPEKRYYELSEIGVGKLQVAMFLSLLVVFASAAATVMHTMGLVSQERLRLMVFIQFFAMLICATLGCYQLLAGVRDLFRGRFTLNTLLVFSFAACCADGVFCFRELRVPCCAAFGLQVTFSLWAEYHKRVTEMAQTDTMRKAARLGALLQAEDYHEGAVGLLRGEGDVDDFTESYNLPTPQEKIFCWYSFAAFLISLGAGTAAYVLHKNIPFALQVTAASMLVAVPATAFITLTRPGAILQKRLHAIGTVLCGWYGVRTMSRKAVFALEHDDLFPTGTCKLNGVKYYGHRDPNEVIAYSTALVSRVGGGLEPLFAHLLETHGGKHYVAENLRVYPKGGVGGEVAGESVLVGSLPFLKELGVEIPKGVRVNQAVYIAIDGELCGLVAVTYVKSKDSAAGLSALCAYRGLYPAMTTGDFMLTEGFIRSKFGVNTRRIRFPDEEQRQVLAERKPDEEAPALALTTRDGLCGYAFAVAGARSLHTASILGTVIHLLGGILGLGMMVVLGVVGAQALLTPSNMLLYQLVWVIPGLLITEWTRAI